VNVDLTTAELARLRKTPASREIELLVRVRDSAGNTQVARHYLELGPAPTSEDPAARLLDRQAAARAVRTRRARNRRTQIRRSFAGRWSGSYSVEGLRSRVSVTLRRTSRGYRGTASYPDEACRLQWTENDYDAASKALLLAERGGGPCADTEITLVRRTPDRLSLRVSIDSSGAEYDGSLRRGG
jgi:hypothetical protein